MTETTNPPPLASRLFFPVAVALIALVIFIDHQKSGTLLPNDWYCQLGAGTYYSERRATGWSMQGNCSAYQPRCATEFTTRNWCSHGSIWDALTGRH